MKYYCGNDYDEAISYPPVEITDARNLREYENRYNFVIPEDEVYAIMDYDQAVQYLEDHGVHMDPAGSAESEYACDLLDTLYAFTRETLDGIIADVERWREQNVGDDLEESVNDNEVQCHNKGLELAKKINKPVVYGYTKGGKFYSIEPVAYHGDDKAFRSQYSANVIHVAYPDKDFVKEDLHEDYDEMDIDQELLDMLSDDNNLELYEDLNDKKQRCIDMYNQCKDWDDKATSRVSCLCNVDEATLKEWLNEVK